MFSPLAFIGLCLIICYFAPRFFHRRPPLPPGPPSLPVIGNLHQIPKNFRWKKYKEWHDKYGPILTVKCGLRTVILLGSYQSARDLLDKRGSIYSSRPHYVGLGDYGFNGDSTTFLPYGQRWKQRNRLQMTLVNSSMAKRYRVLQDVESKQLLHKILLDGSQFMDLFDLYQANLLLVLMYGRRITDLGERYPPGYIENLMDVEKALQDNHVIEPYPWLVYVLNFFGGWKARSQKTNKEQYQVLKRLTDAALESGSWNWSKAMIEGKEGYKVGREEVLWTISSLFEAGHAVGMSLSVFVMAAVLHPDAVKKAQEELDRVVGFDRLPTFDDMPNLPYVNAFIAEFQRWRPIAVTGMPHEVIQDDEYMGYRIPKGTPVATNHWSLEHDEETFGDPSNFRPQRWIDDPELPACTFGFGRRACPGQYIARDSLFSVVSRMLWAFNFNHVYDENGMKKEIDPDNMSQSQDSQPMPFEAAFDIRSPRHQEIIEHESMTCEKDLDVILNEIKPSDKY
ncbi:putative fumitremorgin C synthase [Microsporum canis]|uniref:Cytochrome P450 2C38 n=1 Tax=Arthroderma otae (strain ATCC MYA-4605 / CBS 113480) TaxID=554155 RepID=C5G0R0_ARTOC|nr:cytochrome P450 2C38 [Microsporum canis CBS 113480]EEQ35713.1 cytochrome P450 2C38 [Microsporum canis CBS 113480]